MKSLTTFMLLFVTGIVAPVMAQISAGGEPVSFSHRLSPTIDTITLPAVDAAALLAEDELEQQEGDIPLRFGYPFPVDVGLDRDGTWETLPNGDRVWRLKLECPGAYSINLVFDRYWLPEGAQLFLYNGDRSDVRGAFTASNNKPYGQFSTAPIPGDVQILEYIEPANVDQAGEINIMTVVHAYRPTFNPAARAQLRDFGDSGSCNNNVNCPEGEPWQDEKRSVALITTQGGFRLCTGALVNNALQDQTPYFLTANHCLGGETSWVFIFNYESPGCEDVDGPTDQSISGCSRLAANSASDFGLLLLSANPPEEYEVYYAGWSAVDTPSPHSVGIHHPSGDIKKISFDDDPVTSWAWPGTPADSHWRIGSWDDGTTEGGSSGSPLFDPDHRIVGQLHGGSASCTSLTYDAYGKFSVSWDYGSTPSTRLVDWLDPEDSGITVLDGLDAALSATISGTVTSTDGDPLRARVWVEGDRSYETEANENGEYLLETYPGTYTLYAEFFGYYPSEGEMITLENGDAITIDVTLEAQPTGTLQGMVSDVQTGEPLTGATIQLLDVPIPAVMTSPTGFYQFEAIPADYQYTVQCVAPSYGEQTAEVFINAGETVEQDFALQRAQSFEEDDGNWSGTGLWEWGIPQESGGPATAYEGQYCWGTDLDGRYRPFAN
ncbi:MAG: hypothetical protein D6675_02145, partial [Gemmatimonadetes bacterium]